MMLVASLWCQQSGKKQVISILIYIMQHVTLGFNGEKASIDLRLYSRRM